VIHTPLFLTSDQVAAAIGMANAAAFNRARPRLEAENNFPRPLPTQRRNRRWKADEVQSWLDRYGNAISPDIRAEDIASGKVHILALARSV